MIEIIACVAAFSGIILFVIGAIVRYIDNEPNSMGGAGIALFVVGLLLTYGPHA